MKYYSTNKQSPIVDFKEATIKGQAPDKGLYFPEVIPQVEKSLIDGIKNFSNEEIAFRVMPHLTGLDVLTAMRSDPRWEKLPCIILTAAGQEQQHQRALELGASEFLTKPFSPKKLYQRAAELAGLAPQDAGADGPPP